MSAPKTKDYKEFAQENWETTDSPDINLASMRRYLVERIPFYSSALNQVDIISIDKPDLPSFGFTNGYQVFISPKLYTIFGKYVTQELGLKWFSTPELGIAFTLLHEIGHIIFDSFGRQNHRDAQLWNVATDYQINQFVVRLMKEANIFKSDASYADFMEVIQKNLVLDPAKYLKLSAEDTYADIYKKGKGGGDFGSFALNGDMQEDPNAKPLTPEEQMQRDIIKEEMKNYAAKNASKLPGSGSSFGRDLEFIQEPPKVSLRDVLKQITDRESGEDWTWTSRGSRMDHLMDRGIRLPVISDTAKDKVKKLVFVLDSSGSLSSDQLNDALNIVKSLKTTFTKNPIWLIVHTDQICFSGDINDCKEVPKNISGGTNFRVVLDEISRIQKEEHIHISATLWFTDLYGELQPAEYNNKNFPFHKNLRWIISGSDLVAPIGKSYHIDILE